MNGGMAAPIVDGHRLYFEAQEIRIFSTKVLMEFKKSVN